VTQSIHDKLFASKGIEADVLRLDLIHPEVSGNKWFKLKYYLSEAISHNKTGMVSFGGAYSNHLVAMAFACHEYGMTSAAIIRGDEAQIDNSSIQQMKQYGMKLVFVNRTAYRDKDKLINEFLAEHAGFQYVPEGGQGPQGVRGAAEIMQLAEKKYTHIICAVGTGTTIAGIINGSAANQQVTGISSLKIPDEGENALLTYISQNTSRNNYSIVFNYHFGGYAKKTGELISFMNELYQNEKIPTDFVYTGKLFYATYDMTKKDNFPPGSALLIIHSGGLQGNRSLSAGILDF
jgi:D-cysteine desulfhydrase